jgi:hypothetical protein
VLSAVFQLFNQLDVPESLWYHAAAAADVVVAVVVVVVVDDVHYWATWRSRQQVCDSDKILGRNFFSWYLSVLMRSLKFIRQILALFKLVSHNWKFFEFIKSRISAFRCVTPSATLKQNTKLPS